MTKEEVKTTFKSGDGKAIALAMKEYFAQAIANGTVKPLQFYKSNQENNIRQNEKKDIVEVAQEIFETQGVLLT